MASWLTRRHIAPDVVTVGSKWGYTYTAGWRPVATHHEVKDHSIDVLDRQLDETHRLLGRHLDLYHVHSATLESGILTNQSVLTALARLRDAGTAVGISLSGARQADTLRAAMAVVVDGRPLFDVVQATWNILERSAESALADAHAAGMGVIIKEGVANGRLTDRNLDPQFAAKRRVLADIAARAQTTIDGLALAAILARPWVDVVLSGASTVEQLHANLAASIVRWDDTMEIALAAVRESAEDYWTIRAKLAWN